MGGGGGGEDRGACNALCLNVVRPCPYFAMLVFNLLYFGLTCFGIVYMGYATGNNVAPLVVSLVFYFVVSPIILMVGFFAWYVPLLDGDTELWDVDEDTVTGSFITQVMFLTCGFVIAACVGGIYLSLLGDLNNEELMYNGPVPDGISPALASLAEKQHFRFNDNRRLGLNAVGPHVSKQRTKSGTIELPTYVAPLVSSTSAEVNVWLCSCRKPAAYGCRIYPAIDVTMWKRDGYWYEPDVHEGVRVTSRLFLDRCHRAAGNSIAKLDFGRNYRVGLQPDQGAVFMEWTPLRVYRKQIKVVAWSTLGTFVFASVFAAVCVYLCGRACY